MMPPTDAEVDQAARDFRAAIDAAGPEPWALKHIREHLKVCDTDSGKLNR